MTSADTPPSPRALGPRERMVRSAMALICEQGVSNTGLRQVVDHAGAPRGSLQHYFPRGKEQLVQEALALAGRAASRSTRSPRGEEPARPSDVLLSMVTAWRAWLRESDYALGCPVVATVADASSSNARMHAAAEQAFAVWQESVEAALRETGVPARRAPGLASVTISALEGAIIMSRSRRSLQPLEAVLHELTPLLDDAAG
jgi:AcrR family transcriptional regulator